MGFIVFFDGTGAGGGGGGTVITANGISGDGSSGTPVILGGTLANDTAIALNANLFDMPGNQSHFKVDDTIDAEAVLLEFKNAGGDGGGLSMGHGLADQQLFFEKSTGVFQRLLFDQPVTNSMILQDDVNHAGLINFADYSGSTNPLRLVQLNELSGHFPKLAASLTQTGINAPGLLLTLNTPAVTPHMYRINSNLLFTGGAGTVQVDGNYTDEAGFGQSFGFSILTAAATSTIDAPINIYARQGTAITMSLQQTGTAIATVGLFIEFIQ